MKDFRITSVTILLIVFLLTPVLADSNNGFLKQVGYTTSITYTNAVYRNSTLFNTEGNTYHIYNITQPGVNLSALDVSNAANVMIFPSVPPSPVFDQVRGLMFVPVSHGFNIYDMTDPLHPAKLGSGSQTYYNASLSSVNGFFPNGNYLYTDNGKLLVFDISDPANPVLTSQVTHAADTWSGQFFTKGGNYLYQGFGDGTYGTNIIYTYDISTPSLPVVINSWYYNGTSISPTRIPQSDKSTAMIEYWNNTLYLARYQGWDYWSTNPWIGAQFIAVNVADPHNPVYTGMEAHLQNEPFLGGYRGGILIDGYIYTSKRYGNIGIWDVRNGGLPTRLLTVDQMTYDNTGYEIGYAEQISCTHDGHYCFIAADSEGTAIINVTHKTNPLHAGHINVPTNPNGLNVQMIGSVPVLGAVGRDAGSTYWNISDPEHLTPYTPPTGLFFPAPAQPRIDTLAFGGNYSYSGAGLNYPAIWVQNLTIVAAVPAGTSVSVPYKVILAARTQGTFSNDALHQLYVNSFTALSGHTGPPDNGNWTFLLYSTTDPWNPVLTGHFSEDDPITNATLNPILNTYPDIGTAGGHTRAYNAMGRYSDNSAQGNIEGITIPYHTNYLMYFPGGTAMNIKDASSRVNGINGNLGLWFINIADPAHPFVEKTYGFGMLWFGSAGIQSYDPIRDRLYAYESENASYSQLVVLDMSDMNNIQKLGTFTGKPGGSGAYLGQIARNGTDLYVPLRAAAYQPDYLLIDASNPLNPVLYDQGNYPMSSDSPLYYYNGYVWAGNYYQLIAYKVYASSSAPPIAHSNHPQQTIISQNQQPEQQSESSVIDQIVNQLAELWKKTVNYFIIHLSIQL